MLLSIDAGNKNLYIAEGSYNAGIVNIDKAAGTKLPEETISDGFIKNQAAMAMAINKLLTQKIKTKNTVITLKSSAILSRKLVLPKAKQKELSLMVKNEMVQIVSDTSEMVVEYSVLHPSADKGGTISLWAYAMPKEIVEEFHALFKHLKLRPAAMDIHPNSVEKLFTDARINGGDLHNKAALFADLRSTALEIHLFSDNERAFSRISPVSTEAFDNPFVQENQSQSDIVQTDEFRQYLNRLSDELNKMVQFQLRRDSAHPVSCVYLYGEAALIPGIAQGLAGMMDIPVEIIESISKLKMPEDTEIVKYINAAGALIRL